MRFILKIFLILITTLVIVGCVQFEQNTNPIKRILFVGNSLTYYNDVPAMVAQMYSVIDKNQDVETEMLVQGGYSIEQHLSNDLLELTLSASQYDVVVLQDFGSWPLCTPGVGSCASSSDPLSAAINLIRASGAKPIWYSAYIQIPEGQSHLSKVSRQIAKTLSVNMADVGAAMLIYTTENSTSDILLPDSHPNTLGSWIAAATIVRTIIEDPIPESLVLDTMCRQIWQESDLKSTQLASKQ